MIFTIFSACSHFHNFANITLQRMKGIKLSLIACFTLLGLDATLADTSSNISRTARRPEGSIITSTNRKKNTNNKTTRNATTARTATKTNQTRTITSRNTESAFRTRTAVTPAQRTPTITPQQRTSIVKKNATATRSATRRTPNGDSTISRTATAAQAALLSRDYKKCREILYNCMDEFCANKDAQLKRCACSSRINEFQSAKKTLENIEDKLLDFNQRLLTVNMDKEDAAALNQATEGELAFNIKDRSDSKKTLDEIAKKLNTSFNNSNFDTQLNAISLNLDIDSAFDNIDSLAGASTTTKSGPELYSAALPVCREMALEVCSPEDLKLAEGGYQMMIEQDCNTVQKSYQTQMNQAKSKVHESGALLDMSRLDIHQQRNSDDILTCKSKMLDMLTDTTVCGDKLGKCLDTTGQYIDPTTGDAILSINLSNLGTLITRPNADQSWTTIPENSKFVTFLNNKKKFLEPAMEKCQDISDNVWNVFLEDAMAQIKLAQEDKLEEIRQSCTTLTTQCLDKTMDSISDFDARAISIFGILADKTVNEMCKDVRTSCENLLSVSSETSEETSEWAQGFEQITTQITFDTVLKTCREVGRNCIVRACTSSAGNFGLCENIYKSTNRKSIINRNVCWNEVQECIESAGDINKFFPADVTNLSKPLNQYTNNDNIYSWCDDMTDDTTDDTTEEKQKKKEDKQKICRLTEQIWGNCEFKPDTLLINDNETNKILTTQSSADETLLEWFAKNTGTAEAPDNCRDTTCPPGFLNDPTTNSCQSYSLITNDGIICRSDKGTKLTIGTDDNSNRVTNCCQKKYSKESSKEYSCEPLNKTNYGCIKDNIRQPNSILYGSNPPSTICVPPNTTTKPTVIYSDNKQSLVCMGTVDETDNGFNCAGIYVLIDNKQYTDPTGKDNVKITYAYKKDNTTLECPTSNGYGCPKIEKIEGGFITYGTEWTK